MFQEPHQSWLLPRVHTAGGTQGLDSADREIWGTRPELALGTSERAESGATRGPGISADVESDVRTKKRLGQAGTGRSILGFSAIYPRDALCPASMPCETGKALRIQTAARCTSRLPS